ncbi:site-specific DNA-methyltransferase [Terriglobus aquaticus]|uniref:Site-specific DNA-methyltransferase n=1 Tax=Terriglobus aquaticus TaxID=940139 RepID=A0ABW9KJW2_9BACT|nr:site-specific DNA-methyltransferase [Terriglobus aquaticus]
MGSGQSIFEIWTGARDLHCYGTNAFSAELPFQSWRRFKEAFAPELIHRAVESSAIPVRTCLDPFGGSGTTALASQFLGVYPITIEVNPFLADLIEAKLTKYDTTALARDLGRILRQRRTNDRNLAEWASGLPATFIEPGDGDRWLFSRAVGTAVLQLLAGLDRIENPSHRRLFRVVLGGILVDASNVRISGKGRRYRANWRHSQPSAQEVVSSFAEKAQQAIVEVHRFDHRPEQRYKLIRGDCRNQGSSIKEVDLVVFSPPYPNSFDYTDVYNVELWTLGYLRSSQDNHRLRKSTFSSHVQIKRDFASAPKDSRSLNRVLKCLELSKDQLWSRHIPAMVGGYFADLAALLNSLQSSLRAGGSIWMCVGDSQYNGIRIPTAAILAELSRPLGFIVTLSEPVRSMRSSPQQGGKEELPETLLVLQKKA